MKPIGSRASSAFPAASVRSRTSSGAPLQCRASPPAFHPRPFQSSKRTGHGNSRRASTVTASSRWDVAIERRLLRRAARGRAGGRTSLDMRSPLGGGAVGARPGQPTGGEAALPLSRHPAPFDPDCEAAHSEEDRTRATLCLDRSEEGPMERWSEIHPVEERIHASLENLVFALGEVAGADRSSLFVVDEEHSQLWLAVAKTDGQPLDV